MCDSSDPEIHEDKCLVCCQIYNVSPHFGSTCCQACASFFRRTVSLNIRYICKKNNRCPIFHKVRIICRSCRFQRCVQSGMRTDAVQPRRNYTKIPKYVEEYRKNTNGDTILRDYATSSLSKHMFSPEVERTSSNCSSGTRTSPSLTEISESDAGPSRFSSLLDISHDELLQFYCEQTKFSLNQRNSSNSEMGDVATQFCKICPGADLLKLEELEVLYRYSFFSCEIMDSVWAESQFPDSYLNTKNRYIPSTKNDNSFFYQIELSLYDTLKFLNVNGVEYSALKSMCIWKLGMCDFTVSMKLIAQEQYSSICGALKLYYEETLKKSEMHAVTRIADFTLVLGKIFESYCAMIVGFKKRDIPLVFNV